MIIKYKFFLPTWTVVSLPSPSTAYALKLECNTELWGWRINLKSFPNVLKCTSLIVLKGWLDNFAPRLTTWCASFEACMVSKYFRLWYIEPKTHKIHETPYPNIVLRGRRVSIRYLQLPKTKNVDKVIIIESFMLLIILITLVGRILIQTFIKFTQLAEHSSIQ